MAVAASIPETIVSTDDEKLGKFCTTMGARVVDQPAPMRHGTVNAVNVVLWWIKHLKEIGEEPPSVIVMLLPTAPFRPAKDIVKAIRRVQRGAESVIGVTEAKPLECLRKVEDNILHPVTEGDLNIQRQDVNKIYAVNGALYVSTPEVLEQHKSFHTPKAEPLYMEQLHSVDINNPADLEYARKVADSVLREFSY